MNLLRLPAELSAEKITKLISLEVTLAFHEKNLKRGNSRLYLPKQ